MEEIEREINYFEGGVLGKGISKCLEYFCIWGKGELSYMWYLRVGDVGWIVNKELSLILI